MVNPESPNIPPLTVMVNRITQFIVSTQKYTVRQHQSQTSLQRDKIFYKFVNSIMTKTHKHIFDMFLKFDISMIFKR